MNHNQSEECRSEDVCWLHETQMDLAQLDSTCQSNYRLQRERIPAAFGWLYAVNQLLWMKDDKGHTLIFTLQNKNIHFCVIRCVSRSKINVS